MGSDSFIRLYIYKGNNIKPYKTKKFVGLMEYEAYIKKKNLIYMNTSYLGVIRMKKAENTSDKNKKTDITSL